MTVSVIVARDVGVVTRGVTRLDGVDCEIRSGCVHAILGANGSGKSSLLGVLAGDIDPTSGEVSIGGEPWARVGAREAARRRSLLAQETPSTFPFTVQDVVRWGRLPWRGTSRQADDDAVVERCLELCGVATLRDRPITGLSGGERARTHLARVLAQEAPVVLLDEADATLDPAGREHLDEVVRMLRDEGTAVVLTSHHLERVLALADEVTVLRTGRVLAAGPTRATLTTEVLSEAYGISGLNSGAFLGLNRPENGAMGPKNG